VTICQTLSCTSRQYAKGMCRYHYDAARSAAKKAAAPKYTGDPRYEFDQRAFYRMKATGRPRA
jgi:hypothetical protein